MEQAAVLERLFGVEVVLAPDLIVTAAVEDVRGQQRVGLLVGERGAVASKGAALVVGEHCPCR